MWSASRSRLSRSPSRDRATSASRSSGMSTAIVSEPPRQSREFLRQNARLLRERTFEPLERYRRRFQYEDVNAVVTVWDQPRGGFRDTSIREGDRPVDRPMGLRRVNAQADLN